MKPTKDRWDPLKLFLVLQTLPIVFFLFLGGSYFLPGPPIDPSLVYAIQEQKRQEFIQGLDFVLFFLVVGLPFTAWFMHEDRKTP